MNILYIVPHDFNSCKFGSEQRTHLLYKSLQEIGNVYVVQVSRRMIKVGDKHWEIAPRRQKGLKRLVCSAWWRIAHLICPNMVLTYLPFAHKLDVEKAYPDIKFDVVVTRYLDVVGETHCWNLGNLYVDIDDYPMQVFETSVADGLVSFRRVVARQLQRLMVWLCMRKLTGAWIANPEQLQLISTVEKSGVLRNMPIISHVNVNVATIARRNYIFTVGLMSYAPNYKGVDSFLKNVWPSIRATYPHLEYWIAGMGVPEGLVRSWEQIDGVRLMGYVDDLMPLYENCIATVVPVDSGGGTCIKTLESLACGRICFATPFGARGFKECDISKDKLGLFIYQTADSFIRHLDLILNDELVRSGFEKQNITWFNANYSFEAFEKSVRKVLID